MLRGVGDCWESFICFSGKVYSGEVYGDVYCTRGTVEVVGCRDGVVV